MKIAAVNTIKKIALTDEEAAMNGAPEGELFNVELLERGDVAGMDMGHLEGRRRGGAGVVCPHGENKHTDRQHGRAGPWLAMNTYRCITQLTPLSPSRRRSQPSRATTRP